MSEVNFKDYELTQMSKEEILTKAKQLQKTLNERFGERSLQHCVEEVIKAYASYNPQEERVGRYA